MNFASMDYFIAVARERNITRAAESLHITQQTLSAHIAGIEKELGCQLILRRVPLELTYAGEVFLQYAEEIQKKLNAMGQEFGDISGNQKGVLRIGVAITRGHAIMPSLIGAFQRQYPQIMVQLVENANDKLREDLENGLTDLMIGNFPEALPGIEIADFYQEEVVLAVSERLLRQIPDNKNWHSEKKIRPGELDFLRKCPLLLNTKQDIAGKIGYRLLAEAGIVAMPRVTSCNMETLLGMCENGMGACFCPENLLKMTLSPEQKKKLRIFHFAADMRYMIRFGFLKQSYQWTMISKFIDLARRMEFEAGGEPPAVKPPKHP